MNIYEEWTHKSQVMESIRSHALSVPRHVRVPWTQNYGCITEGIYGPIHRHNAYKRSFQASVTSVTESHGCWKEEEEDITAFSTACIKGRPQKYSQPGLS